MDEYDKITNETLNEAYKKFLKLNENKQLSDIDKYYQSDNTTSLREIPSVIYSDNGCDRTFIDKMIINGYEIKPDLMNKIKSFEDFNVFLESCKNNVIEDTNRQKTASVLSRTIATNYDKKEIKLLVEYLKDYLNNTKKSD